VLRLAALACAAILLLVLIWRLYFNPEPARPLPTPGAADPTLLPSSPTPSSTATSRTTGTQLSAPYPNTWTASPIPNTPTSTLPRTTALPSPTPSSTLTPSPSPPAHWAANPTAATITITPDVTPVTAIPSAVPTVEVPDRIINILLLGSDQRPNTRSWLTDVMILVSINPDGPSVAMLSIPRDLYVYVPEWKMNKINTVDAYGEAIDYPGGGPGLLQQTILYNLGIPVHYYARVGFDGFVRIVDTLGGLDVPVTCAVKEWKLISPELEPEDEENWYIHELDQRVHHMDGDLALWYVRQRKRSSDWDRNRRQQQVLRAMLTRGLQLNIIPQVPQLWSDLSQTVSTDLGLGEILQLAAMAPKIQLNQVKSRFLGGDALVVWETPDQNLYTLLPQYDNLLRILDDVLQPPAQNRAFQDPPVVEIWNGTNRPDLNLLASDNLAWEGLVPILGAADRNDYTQTQVVFYGANFKGASTWIMAKLFGIYESQILHQPDPASPVDYRVILGYNYEPCVHKVQGALGAPTVTPTPAWTPPPG